MLKLTGGVRNESDRVEAGRDHGSHSREEDVEEEENDVHWWINLHNCEFAGSQSLGDFGVSHLFLFYYSKP